MSEMAEKALTLRLPKAVYDDLRAIAETAGMSITHEIREAIGAYVAARKSDPLFVAKARQEAAWWQSFAGETERR